MQTIAKQAEVWTEISQDSNVHQIKPLQSCSHIFFHIFHVSALSWKGTEDQFDS